jgi:hypothetical protein
MDSENTNDSTHIEMIDKLQTDQTLVFYTPLEDETSVYIRTGITKNNSFLHSVLSAQFSDYLFMKKNQRKILAEKTITEMYKLTKDDWMIDDSSTLKKFCALYILAIKSKIDNEEFISRDINEVILDNLIISKEVCNLFFTIVDINTIFKSSSSLKLTNSEFKDTFKTKILEVFDNCKELKMIDSNRSEYILKQLDNFINIFLETIEKLVYSEFLDSSISKEISINDDVNISDFFKHNILVIDSETRLPLKSEHKINENYETYIVLLKFKNKNLYEIIGEMLPGYITIRVFDKNSRFIEKIKKEINCKS